MSCTNAQPATQLPYLKNTNKPSP
uniref:Uncharacterized protein n=1 Tax=Anguilla anguilla TaxID=7936 RepID=A0A0E9QFM4_ANGAN